MLEIINKNLVEKEYNIAEEAKLSSVFGIGNGYYGIRGSFEEFGDVFIQGLYIRGVFDKIVEIPSTFADNIYMKKYYFDVQKIKEFELEDSTINICDPLTIRYFVNGKLFLPWEGKIVKWTRYIDIETGGLVRNVIWDDGEGNLTEFGFVRYASFSNNHLILQKSTVKKINHDLPIEILVGVDTLVKTNGQHKSKVTNSLQRDDGVDLDFYFGDFYNMSASLSNKYEVEDLAFTQKGLKDSVYFSKYVLNGTEGSISKVTSMYMCKDPMIEKSTLESAKKDVNTISYDKALEEHLIRYKKDYSLINVDIEGNDKADVYLKYANYQTLIGFDRFDSVHSLSAKNLTSEKYNQFVWWDCEIFQLPILISLFPEAARSCLEYRYRSLNEAKKKAINNGYSGAMFAFCSSVKGDEQVWIYARHPFLQIHICADIAYGIHNYYQHTKDDKFMMDMGLEMMKEVSLFFLSRSTFINEKYHILNVTGTDEHHDYIDDNAYTNHLVRFIVSKFVEYAKQFSYEVKEDLLSRLDVFASNLYTCPISDKGIIPQFEGYMNLKPFLPLAGNGAATGFQMKASGLYHESQIIKQPDVLNLFSYVNIGMDESIYKANWEFYEEKCEASSSLTYPTHSICAIDNNDNNKFLVNFFNCIEVDIKDTFKGAHQGVHAACLAGGWYSVYRGILGAKASLSHIDFSPKFDMPFDKVNMKFMYQGSLMEASLDHELFSLTLLEGKEVKITIFGKERLLQDRISFHK